MGIWNEEGSVGMGDDLVRRLVNDGFQRGRAAQRFFHHHRHARVVVHGDDVTFAATESELRKI